MQADETRESKGVEAFASNRAYDTARQVTYASAKAGNAAADRGREMASRAKTELKTRSIKRKYIAGKSKPRNDTAKLVRGSAALRKRQMRLAKKRSTEKLVNQNIHGLQKGTRLTARIGKQMVLGMITTSGPL